MSLNIDESNWINPRCGMELYEGIVNGELDNENGILFLAEYYFLKHMLGILSQTDIYMFRFICEGLRTYGPGGKRYEGLFDRSAGDSLDLDPEGINEVSHDNLTAIACFSNVFGLGFDKETYKHGVKNLWRFDNRYPEKPRWARFMHPRDIILWSRLSGSFLGKTLAWFFMWFVYADALYTCGKKGSPDELDTSGKLLTFVRLYTMSRRSWVAKMVWKLCQSRIRKAFDGNGMAFVFEYYFKDPNFPSRVLGRKAFPS